MSKKNLFVAMLSDLLKLWLIRKFIGIAGRA